MIKNINRAATGGQTALVLILLAAATLIFLAVTLNWGRVAQVKAQISIAADQGAAQLASFTASYGEMEKQTYLKDSNQLTFSTGIFLALIMVVIAIIVTIFTWGQSWFLVALAVASVVMSVVNLVLQAVVVQPMITNMWNKMQLDQPVQEQMYEQGLSTALQSSVSDQVQITDYADSNANGDYGSTNNVANDKIGRFALFYTDRLRMITKLLPPIPQVELFYNQLGELMSGETCDENANDVALGLGVSPDPNCAGLNCTTAPSTPVCSEKIPGTFQLSDTCTSSNAANITTYNPYCDPCCQPSPPLAVCPSGSSGNCAENNPYGGVYPYLYDASFQNYNDNTSFLDQYGRDQQAGPFTALTPNAFPNILPSLEFPNGVYPFFWEMTSFSPEVDNIADPTVTPLQPSQLHWCTATVAPGYTQPAGFADLAQLNLPYSCSGIDCCVNSVTGTVGGGGASATSAPVSITLTPGPTVSITAPTDGSYALAGVDIIEQISASEPGGAIASVSVYEAKSGQLIDTLTAAPYTITITAPAAGTYARYAVATDTNNVSTTSSTVTVNVINPPTVTIISPTGGTLTPGTKVVIQVNTTADPGDTVSSVTFSNSGNVIGTAAASPFSLTWTVPNPPPASYSLTAVATDIHGFSSAASAAVTGTIS